MLGQAVCDADLQVNADQPRLTTGTATRCTVSKGGDVEEVNAEGRGGTSSVPPTLGEQVTKEFGITCYTKIDFCF